MRRAALIIAAASSLRFPGGAGVCGLIPAPPAARAAHARTTRTSRLCSSSSSSSSSLPMRLERILANRGVGSRSQVGKLIKQGRVQVRANGEFSVCKTPSMKVDSRAAVLVDGAEVRDPPLLVRYHKPKGVLSTIGDDWGRESLKEVLPEDLLKTYHPVGRLDADTSGLLLLSREGPLTHRLLSPGSLIEREYVAVVTPKENTNRPGQELIDALNAGIQTADG
jgi:16S rRNA U516 pseudouridylate synthase RsuA-like enzyme